VIGGGAAGLAGATALARSRRSVLVLDAGEPRNAPADGVHNYLGREGTSPAGLVEIGRHEVQQYGGQVRRGAGARVVAVGRAVAGGFTVESADGTRVGARRLLLATGAVDRLPDVPGLAERWGRDVLHCPYCHGWEVRDQAIGVLVTSPVAAHSTPLWRQLSDDVTVFLHGERHLGDDVLARLRGRGVRVVEERVAGVLVEDDRLRGVRLAGGDVVPLDALAVTSYVDARTPLVAALADLGVRTAPLELAGVEVATTVQADPTGRTDATGVWAAGNVVDPMAQVVVSAAAGLRAGAMINADLVEEDLATPVAAAS
jgi:thioredoxin reductase